MPAVAPYIPTQQAKFTAWLANFSTLITANPSWYGLLAADAVIIAGYNTTWVAAYTPCTSASTKTAAAVALKNTTYQQIVPLVRAYAQGVAKNAGVSSANKIALGLNPGTSTPAPVTPPTSNPVLVVQYATPGNVVLRYRDSAASVSVKAKPYGATGCQIRGAVLMAPPVGAAALPIIAVATKSPYQLATGGMAVGGTLYLAAAWVTRKQGLSPFSPVISTTVV